MQVEAPLQADGLEVSVPIRVHFRVILSSPILLLILLLAFSAAAEEPGAAAPPEAEWALPSSSLLPAPEPLPASARILGLHLFAMTGSLADDRHQRLSDYALPWGRGPLELGERALGLAWGWRF